jgi:ABC-2 type transport system permease protein
MRPLLEAELIKLRTTRTFVALALVAIATSLLLTGLVAGLSSESDAKSSLADVFQSDTSSLFITILAIVGITGEWRHRTITSSLLAAPDRIKFLAAKTLAFAAAGLVLSLAISITITIVGWAILDARSLPIPSFGDLMAQIGRNAAIAALLAALGVGIGSVLRNQAVAVVAVLVTGFAVEPALLAVASHVGRFGPFTALATSISSSDPTANGFDKGELLGRGPAVAAMLGWIAVFFGAGAALLVRRDVE